MLGFKTGSTQQRADGDAATVPPPRQDRISGAGRRWREENAEAAQAWSDWLEKNGVPLGKYRQF